VKHLSAILFPGTIRQKSLMLREKLMTFHDQPRSPLLRLLVITEPNAPADWFTRTLNPTYDVADGVLGLRSVMVNLYFVRIPGGENRWVLIDAGLPISGPAIRQTIDRELGGKPPEAILLTHGHFDHTGVLKTLADEWDVPVYAHTLELPFLNGTASYAPPDPWVGGSLALTSPMYPRGPVDVRDHLQPLPEDGLVPLLDDWRWVHTPGHSPGHVSFFRERDRTLIAGDAFVTTRQEHLSSVLAQTQILCGPPRYFTHDWGQAEESVKQLAALEPEVAATGHGKPMRGEELREQLNRLATEFSSQIPTGGRYAEEPVIYDEKGPEQVPAAKPIPRAAIAIGVGIAVAGVIGLAAAVAADEQTRRQRGD
jgi:glyoxylase-like metal-dependent hydrolase (beta-lactamase superfamily II)